MEAADLIRRALEQREFWVDLGDGRGVKLRSLAPLEIGEYDAPATLLERVARLCRQAVAWRGFTEATILGAAHGSSDSEAPFSPDLLDLYLRSNVDACTKLQRAMVERVRDDIKRRKDVAKNSAPSSTA